MGPVRRAALDALCSTAVCSTTRARRRVLGALRSTVCPTPSARPWARRRRAGPSAQDGNGHARRVPRRELETPVLHAEQDAAPAPNGAAHRRGAGHEVPAGSAPHARGSRAGPCPDS